MHGITKETYIHNNNLHTCSGCALSSYLETVPETWGLSTFVCNFQIFGSLRKWPPQANSTADQQSNTYTNNTSWVHRVYRTHVEQTFFTCTRSARCSKSLTHSNQCMRHKYMLSWQMASLEGKSHQELMPSMQYTHCRQITNQIIAAVFKKHKYWAALITYYLISLPVLLYANQIPFGSNEGRISVPHTCWNTPQSQRGQKGLNWRFIV